MANLTITVDEDVLRRARIRALEQGTSVNGVLREFLRSYAAAASAHERATRLLLKLADQSASRRGRRRWSREELHDRATLR